MNYCLQILGVYTFTRKVTLDEFETKPRKTSVRTILVHSSGVHLHVCLVIVSVYVYDSTDRLSRNYRGMPLFPTSTASTTSAIHQLSSKFS